MRRAHWGVAVAAVLLGCGKSEPEAGILLALNTELTVPKEVTKVGLYVEHLQKDRRTLVVSQEVEPKLDPVTNRYDVTFVATFAIQSGVDVSDDRIRTRFIGYGPTGAPIAMREARTAVPGQDVRQLRLPLLFVNAGRVEDTLAPGVAGASAGLELLQAADTASDPFTRYRHPECGVDETLGDDGECVTIDVDLETLPQGPTYVASSTTCFDAAACFGPERGVRELPLEADCTVRVPESEATGIALAVRSAAGYETGRADGALVHPIERGLYTYDPVGHVATLNRALCARAQAEPSKTVLVSILCAPRAAEVPICSPWQNVTTPAPPAAPDQAFPGDPETPDATGDATVDSGEEPDAGPPPEPFFRDVELRASSNEITSFAARGDGKIWLMEIDTAGMSRVGIVAPGSAGGVPVDVQFPYEAGHFQLGGDKQRAYVAPSFGTETWPHWIDEGGPVAAVPVRIGDCAADPSPVGQFAVGNFNGNTVAIYGGTEMLSPIGAGLVDPANPGCFPTISPNAELDPNPAGLYRGTTFAGSFRVPAGDAPQLLGANPALSLAPLPARFHPSNSAPVYMQSLVALDPQRALVIGKALVSSAFVAAYYDLTLDGAGELVLAAQPRKTYDYNAAYEVFAGEGVICARLEGYSGAYAGVQCLRVAADGTDTDLDVSQGSNVPLRLYGDDDYLYTARVCNVNAVRTMRMVATPWRQVSSQTPRDVLFRSDCTGIVL